MTWDEFWGEFDKRSYARSIQCLKEHQLRNEHAKIRAKVVAAKSATAMSTAVTLHTLGFSVVGMGIGARKATYNSQKLRIIEERMRCEGWSISEMSTGDFLMAAGPAAVAGVLGTGAEHLIGHAAGHGAAAFTGHHIADTMHAVEHHSSDFIHAAENGAASQIHAVTHAATGLGDPTQLVPIDAVANNSPSFLGYAAGQGAANAAEIKALNCVFDKVAETSVREGVKSWRNWGGRTKCSPEISVSTKKSERKEYSRDNSARREGKVQYYTAEKDSQELSEITPTCEEAATGPFLLPMLPPNIAGVAGFTALQFFTIGAMWIIAYKKRTIREIPLDWMLLSLSILFSSVFYHDILPWLMITIEIRMFLVACRKQIVTPQTVAMLASFSWTNYVSGKSELTRTGNFMFGIMSSAIVLSAVQYNTGFGKGYARSLTHLRWYHWRRPEILLLLLGPFCLLVLLAHTIEIGAWVFFGALSATAFLSWIQRRARRMLS